MYVVVEVNSGNWKLLYFGGNVLNSFCVVLHESVIVKEEVNIFIEY